MIMANRKHRRMRLIEAGHTPKEFEEQWQAGYQAGAEAFLKTAYAAVCLAANDLHGFGFKRCKALLQAMDKHILYTLTDLEAIDEVYQRMGLKLVFTDPFERVQEDEAEE